MISRFCGPNTYCGDCWRIDKTTIGTDGETQYSRDKKIKWARTGYIASGVFLLLAITFCALSTQYHRPLTLYLSLFSGSLILSIVCASARLCCFEKPKPSPKPPKDEEKT